MTRHSFNDTAFILLTCTPQIHPPSLCITRDREYRKRSTQSTVTRLITRHIFHRLHTDVVQQFGPPVTLSGASLRAVTTASNRFAQPSFLLFWRPPPCRPAMDRESALSPLCLVLHLPHTAHVPNASPSRAASQATRDTPARQDTGRHSCSRLRRPQSRTNITPVSGLATR